MSRAPPPGLGRIFAWLTILSEKSLCNVAVAHRDSVLSGGKVVVCARQRRVQSS